MSTSPVAAEAIEALAKRIYFHENCLDPIGRPDWDSADEEIDAIRRLYRCLVERLIKQDRHLLETALIIAQ
jgi:hypothetical protein